MSHHGRFDMEGDESALQFFSEDNLRLTPEEYVARYAHTWGCFSFHLYRYRDQALGAWVKKVGALLGDLAAVERCRQRFLSVEERSRIQMEEAEGL